MKLHLKTGIIFVLIASSIFSLDEKEKLEFMKNGHKYAEMLGHTYDLSKKMEFMRNGGNFKEAVRVNVFHSTDPVKKEKIDEQKINKAFDSIVDEQQEEKQSLPLPEKENTPPNSPKNQRTIKLAPVHSGTGHIIINLYTGNLNFHQGGINNAGNYEENN